MPSSIIAPFSGDANNSSSSSMQQSHQQSNNTTASSSTTSASSRKALSPMTNALKSSCPEQAASKDRLESNQHRPGPLGQFLRALVRKKPLDGRTDTKLNRCLNLLDLTTLGVGSTLGLGLYVLAGQVASNKAGPAVVLSFAFAALASAFSAICYAEFAGRVPRAGSAYAYSYITVGEFCAFIIGWNLILEYVIGASSVARGFSSYLRFVCDHILIQIKEHYQGASQNSTTSMIASSVNQTNNLTVNHLARTLLTTSKQLTMSTGLHGPEIIANLSKVASRAASDADVLPTNNMWDSIKDYIWRYFDWISIAIVIVLTIFILFGVKESTNLTLLFTTINMIVVVVVVISSLGSIDLHNWQLKKEELPTSGNAGEGGFMPFGWSGVLAGSATCFFGFIGFDTIASSAEEAENPRRNVPLSIILSLFISFLAYMAIAVVQTLIWPYYAQDNVTILPYIFSQLNMPVTYWIVLIGAIAGLASSQLGGIYPLPRILYSMAEDKLIYGSLAKVNKRLKLPVRATLIGSLFVALLACLLDIQDLADMVSIGTLAAYSLVSLSVLIIRYEDRSDVIDDSMSTIDMNGRSSFSNNLKFDGDQACGRSKTKDQISLFVKEDWKSMRDYNKKTPTIDLKLSLDVDNCGQDWPTKDAMKSKINGMRPTNDTSRKSKVYILIIVGLTIILNLIAISLTSWISDGQPIDHNKTNASTGWFDPYLNLRTSIAYSGVVICLALIFVVYKLSRLPTGISVEQRDIFMVPLVPITPTLSILVNTFLMLNLSYLTWLRFLIWMAIGLFIYFSYGIWHSEGYYLHPDDVKKKVEAETKL